METPWKILRNDRTFIAGRTGSGKSYLARYLLRQFPSSHVVILDPAGGFPIERAETEKDWEISKNPQSLGTARGRKLIYRPEAQWMDPEIWELIYKWIYERKHTILYIDEILHVSDPVSLRPSKNLLWLLMTGRKRGIGMIASAQRPRRIPISYLSESDHHFCFSLNLRDDRRRMAEIMGDEVIEDPADRGGRYAFWYQGRGVDRPLLCKLK